MLRYFDSLEGLTDYELSGFCDGWKQALSEEQLRELVANSAHKVLAADTEARRVVGIITALSDRVNWAFIPYLEVIPSYQKRGIGRELLRRMLDKLAPINCVDLTCDTDMQAFYEKFGMLKSVGMVLRKYLDR